MNTLEKMFPSLTTFSDLNWEAVTQEYETTSINLSFPEYLQQKAIDGDCPPYLFELAYFELALFDAKTSAEPFPFKPGIYLNPTALFLSLSFDVKRMLDEAAKGNVDVFERDHVLCLFKKKDDGVETLELAEADLMLLQELEAGPRFDREFIPKDHPLIKKGLILDLL